MIKTHSQAVSSLLDELEGRHTGRPERRRGPIERARWTPTVVKLSDPREDIEDVLKALDDEVVPGRRRSRWLQRHSRGGDLTRDRHGLVVFEGRKCCVEAMFRMEKRLHLLKPGDHDFACENCGAQYRIVNVMR